MSLAAEDPDALLQHLGIAAALPDIAAYLGRQRWSGAHDTGVESAVIEDCALLREGEPTLLFAVVRASLRGGRSLRCALPLGLRAATDPFVERAPDHVIGRVDRAGDTAVLYDALGDAEYVHLLWRALLHDETLPTRRGAVVCSGAGLRQLDVGERPSVRLLTAEQSNTSFVLGETVFLKHVRRVEEGPSAELEMAAALEQAGYTHIAPVLAHALYRWDGEPSPLLLAQPFLRNGSEGWALALTSLRDLYADAEEHAGGDAAERRRVVDEQGGAFVAEAARLGAAAAEMHTALSRPGLGPDIGPVPLRPELLAAWADSMTADLDTLLGNPAPSLDPLRQARQALVSRFDSLRDLPGEGLCTRIHGDLHLGQTLRTDTGWILLDFEGEPDRSPAERRARSSPLRDVAGMLRSFDYAAAVALAERMPPDSADWEAMMAFGDAWASSNRDAFWSAYLEAAGPGLLPAPRAALALLRAFEVQKAVYETGYELGHRPTWVSIPLRFLLRGLGT